ncbi:hypothetical protein [Demequina gelatinilytica]|uniref:hypothetical protein n=1 Tax=Demequina gelatinilytica TaxID=1638980 RepID=UPI0012E03E86|nr:hypothetical protein [Demequina gelatinilytica]
MKGLEREVDRIYTALVVRDPGTTLSTGAYEGLRKQVVAAASERQAHVAQLAEMDVALQRGATTDDLRNLVTQWLAQAGVERVTDPSEPHAFDSASTPGPGMEVEVPAYRVAVTGQLVRQGRLRPVPRAEAPVAPDGADGVDKGGLDRPNAVQVEGPTASAAVLVVQEPPTTSCEDETQPSEQTAVASSAPRDAAIEEK